jgi:hypothetical protein
MKVAPFSFVLKTVLLFAAIVILIDVCRRLIFLKFDLTQFFQIDFLFYDVLLEYVFVFVSGMTTYFVTKRIKSTELGASFIVALVYSFIYSVLCSILFSMIDLWLSAIIDLEFDFYNSFLRFIPSAFYVGILYVLVWRIKSKKLQPNEVG